MPSSLVMSEVSPANLAARGEGVEGAFAKDKDGPCGSSSSNGLPSSPPQSTSVHCRVSCRIPTDEFGPLRLLLYTNTLDKEEHTVIVFGEAITSASLEAVTGPHESEMDRLIRGALPLTTTTSSNSSITTATTSSTIAINNVITADAPHNNMDNMIENKGGSSSSATACYQRPPVLTRIHSACFTGETLCSARCDCAEQLYESMRLMSEHGEGVIIYLKQEGRGIGLMDKMRAYNLQDLGHDTVQANLMLSHPPDKRSYQVASLFLRDLNVTKLRLLTNNPDKIRGLERDGDVEIVERLSMIPRHWQAIIQQHRSRGDGVDQVQEEDGGEEVLLLDQQQQHQHHQDQLRRSCLSPLVPASVTSTNTAPIPLPSLSSPYATVIKDEPLSTLEGENASISQTILTTTSSIINHSSIIVPSSLDHQQPNSLDHSSTMTANVSLSKQQSSRHSASTGTNNNNSSSRSSNYRRSSSHSRSPTRTGLQRLPPVVALTKVDEYIITKVERMQHMLDIPKELLDIIHKI